jgi:uncharacterized membrane protein
MVNLRVGCVHLQNHFSVYLPLFPHGQPDKDGQDSSLPAAVQNQIACDSLDGIQAVIPQPLAEPLQSGQAISLRLSTTGSLPGGRYRLPVIATGGGVTRSLEIELEVHEPRFSLQAEPANVSLRGDESVEVRISAEGVKGESDPIYLELLEAPEGLTWSFNQPVIRPGEVITLTLADTAMAVPGSYALAIAGEDGENYEITSLALSLEKPEFAIQPEKARLKVQAGEAATFALDLLAGNGWMQPVTLTVSEAGLPGQASASFVTGEDLEVPGSPAGAAAEISLTPPDSVHLVVATSPDTPAGKYRILVEVWAEQIEYTLALLLEVDDGDLVPEPEEWKMYLPLITVQTGGPQNLTYPGIGEGRREGR